MSTVGCVPACCHHLCVNQCNVASHPLESIVSHNEMEAIAAYSVYEISRKTDGDISSWRLFDGKRVRPQSDRRG